MYRRVSPLKMHGFALVEALVALLLLAVAMLGAVAAVIESLAGQRGALLQTQAADLAGNLAEALRAAPDAAAAAAEIASWQASVPQRLPVAAASALPLAFASGSPASMASAAVEIRLEWRDGRAASPALLSLPLGLDFLPVAP